jgi:hypothetical protein
MFIVTWLFDKLGYIPKIDVQVGIVNDAWPFPVPKEEVKKPVKKPALKKATTRKPAVKKVK